MDDTFRRLSRSVSDNRSEKRHNGQICDNLLTPPLENFKAGRSSIFEDKIKAAVAQAPPFPTGHHLLLHLIFTAFGLRGFTAVRETGR